MNKVADYITFILFFVSVAVVFFTLGLNIAPKTDPLKMIYEDYNNIHIEEDGSYSGRTISGVYIEGCINGALCSK